MFRKEYRGKQEDEKSLSDGIEDQPSVEQSNGVRSKLQDQVCTIDEAPVKSEVRSDLEINRKR